MRGLIRTAAMLVLMAISLSAHAGALKRQAFASASLQRDVSVLVYLPDGYAENATRLPVVYLLHGAVSDETVWIDRTDIKDRLDRLMKRGAIPPAIVVMPGCPSCWWVDGARDKAETAFWSELVPWIDAAYRTVTSREGRMLVGVSAGGYGAIRFAMKHPDRVGAIAALSPAIYAVTPPAISAARREPPFLRRDGQFNQPLWSAENYPRLTAGYFQQPHRVAMTVFSGDHDEFGIAFESRRFSDAMNERQQGQVDLRILEGRHEWALWSRCLDEALADVMRGAPRERSRAAASSR